MTSVTLFSTYTGVTERSLVCVFSSDTANKDKRNTIPLVTFNSFLLLFLACFLLLFLFFSHIFIYLNKRTYKKSEQKPQKQCSSKWLLFETQQMNRTRQHTGCNMLPKLIVWNAGALLRPFCSALVGLNAPQARDCWSSEISEIFVWINS